ncbi:type II toxin-antitoxin system RelE/ParE family toxin [Rhizobium sp. AG855]|uniref:type II toxin-antitoxin system RelE/ParE family toxin n=1 Tax=Rhizobium sp. AG855 TaxID=2183898 RepID=UPI000E75AB89|nr:type II toxin-antitoxin system RelE/ParE family toxin [Rhizobium sp. AG855]RKE83760.1 toxin ParE1/3/4 [Rhizobium sp. AG855]
MEVTWTLGALGDLEEIGDYIATDSPRAAHQITVKIWSRTHDLLSENPNIGRKGRALGTRELVIVGTPYFVVYRISDRVEILAVVHGAQDWPKDA